MCLILFAYHIHPDYPLVLAANRDEFHARPTRVAQWWDDCPNLLAGQDLTAGGTWMGITKKGCLAAVTNYRDPAAHNPTARSRGSLTTDFLQQQVSAKDYQKQLQSERNDYNGYNLLFGSVDNLHYFSNQENRPTQLSPGIYGLSNHLLNTAWPKVKNGKQGLKVVLQQREIDLDSLWELLEDPTIAPDDELPNTGIGTEWERTLSATRITGDHYGTRASTLLLVRNDRQVQFLERTLLPATMVTEVTFNFQLQQQG